MSTASSAVADLANSGGSETCTVWTETCTVSPLQAAISDLIKTLHPRKAWAFVGDAFGLKERAAKHRLKNRSSFTIEELQILFHGEDGWMFFETMMEGCAADWWLWQCQVKAQADKRRLIAEVTQEALQLEAQLPPTAAARRLTKGNADAAAKLNAALARKETALGFLHQNAHRAADRAVAPAASAKRGGRGR